MEIITSEQGKEDEEAKKSELLPLLKRALPLGAGAVREVVKGNSSSGFPDANSQYNWEETEEGQYTYDQKSNL